MAEAFDGGNPALGETRALIVVAGGRIVLERYAEGFGPGMPLPSWSMAKSVTHALVGAAVLQGLVDIDAPMGSPRWPAHDPRAAIPWRQWLNMVDGQDYHELDARLPTANDVAKMLFGAGRLDAARYAASLPLAYPPGKRWNYNSAGEILICDALTRAVVPAPASAEERRSAMLAWMRSSLFDPIGMRSAQPEFDATGLYLGSSFVYATARDFARLGLLYLRDGVWDGHRVLPPGWVDFARTPAPAGNVDVYGAGWWINPPSGAGIPFPALIDTGPERDAFRAEGHDGQIILVVPDRDLIVVRLGLSNDWPALYAWMGRLARALPEPAP
jgi:CubicO group peptidase (beta-lactamase class C family)